MLNALWLSSIWINLVDLIAPLWWARRWDLIFRSSSELRTFFWQVFEVKRSHGGLVVLKIKKTKERPWMMSHGYQISRTLPHASPCTHVQTRHWAYACLENHIEPQNQPSKIGIGWKEKNILQASILEFHVSSPVLNWNEMNMDEVGSHVEACLSSSFRRFKPFTAQKHSLLLLRLLRRFLLKFLMGEGKGEV